MFLSCKSYISNSKLLFWISMVMILNEVCGSRILGVKKVQRRQIELPKVTHPVVRLRLDDKNLRRFNEYGVLPFIQSSRHNTLKSRKNKVSHSDDYEKLVVRMPVLRYPTSSKQNPARLSSDFSPNRRFTSQSSRIFDGFRQSNKSDIVIALLGD